MAYNITPSSLTPTRPAPQAPNRRPTDSPQLSTASLSSSGYNSSFSFNSPASPSSSSYMNSYSGIGGSPSRSNSMGGGSNVVRSGSVSIKEEGTFASWIWKLKWLVLKEQTLSIHKSEVRCCPFTSLFAHYIFQRMRLNKPSSNLVIFPTSSEQISSRTASS